MPDDPFPIGDRTILQLRNQPFALDDYGTMVTPGSSPAVEGSDALPADPLQRLEQKLDAALRAIEALQRRLDSMDAAIARALSR